MASAYEVHAMCTDEVKPEIEVPAKSEIYAQNEDSLVVKALEQWLGQQDYESGALTNWATAPSGESLLESPPILLNLSGSEADLLTLKASYTYLQPPIK